MRIAILPALLATVMLAPGALAQGSEQNQAPRPEQSIPAVQAPTTGQSTAPGQAGGPQTAAQGPASLCQELVAFLRQEEAKKNAPPAAPGAPPAGQPPAAQPPAGQTAAAPPGAGQPPAGPAAAAGQATAAAPAPTAAPQGPGQGPTPSQAAQGPPATAGQSAPIPAASGQGATKPSPVTLEQVEALAGSNDLLACRDAAQKMRRAGVAMPAPLVALAAYDPKAPSGQR